MQPDDNNTRTEDSATSPALIDSRSEWPAAPIMGSLVVWSVLSGGEAVIMATAKLIIALTVYAVARTVCDALHGRVEAAGLIRRRALAGSRMLWCRRRSHPSRTSNETSSRGN
jgi:hypothetical protein